MCQSYDDGSPAASSVAGEDAGGDAIAVGTRADPREDARREERSDGAAARRTATREEDVEDEEDAALPTTPTPRAAVAAGRAAATAARPRVATRGRVAVAIDAVVVGIIAMRASMSSARVVEWTRDG